MQIRDTHILKHRDTGNVKGAFVEFGSKDGLQTALQKNGTVSTALHLLRMLAPASLARLPVQCRLFLGEHSG